jgi:hypothetical protein
MAVKQHDAPRPRLFLSRLHFLIRLLGLVGFQAGLAGVVLLRPGSYRDLEMVLSLRETSHWLLVAGFGAALLALLVEALVVVRVVAGRRSALGLNALVQVVLAVGLFVAVNVWSFRHGQRFDLTRERLFTLPDAVRTQLAALDPASETTIVLYLRHRSSSFADEKPDPFDLEAEQKTVEKVKDLVELFREVGPQFKVEVLDVAAKGFNDKLEELSKQSPELKKAIEDAPENSILVSAGRSVQRLSFNEFYRLDRGASEARDNLVLREVGRDPATRRKEGLDPLTRRVVNVEERRPKVGLLVNHEYLTSEGPVNLFTLAGARKALEANGFDVRDVVLRTPTGEPSADVLAVSKLERLQEELDDLDTEVRVVEREIRLLERLLKEVPAGKLEEVNRLIVEYAEQFNPRFLLARASEGNRDLVARVFGNQLAAAREGLELAREERGNVARELAGLSSDKLSEQKRLKDLRAKLARNVADVDLLIIPRLTRLQTGEPIVSPAFHDLEAKQAQAVRAFVGQGKPILACLDPTNMRAEGRTADRATKPPDDLEKMLAELGIVLGKRTVLYNVEKRAFAGRDDNMVRIAKPLQVPPLRLEPAARTLQEELLQAAYAGLREPVAALGVAAENPLLALPFLRVPKRKHGSNPVRESLLLADRESGRRMNLRLRFLRPVFLDPLKADLLKGDPEVLATSAATWHDEQPFSTAVRPVPRFEPPALDDPDQGTLEARRRGPFTVGVAAELRLPPGWGSGRDVRVAALGQAGLITGAELAPGQERLLLDTCNWLLGRDERLAKPAAEWSYPRVEASEEERRLWLMAARWGLPELFAFLGLVMLLLRRLR